MENRARKALRKKAKKGFAGYPIATVAFYGPTDKRATKVTVGIVGHAEAEPDPMRKWTSTADVRNDPVVIGEALEFIRSEGAKSVVMVDRVIGCPHEEGIDYPEGASCPKCPFWRNRDRWTGEYIQ